MHTSRSLIMHFFWVETTFLTTCLTTALSCSRVIGIFQCWQSSTSSWSPTIIFFCHTARLYQRLVAAHGETQGDKKSSDRQRKPCNLVRACGTQINNSLVCQRLSSFSPWYKTHWGKQTCCLQKALQSEECYWNKGHTACYGCREKILGNRANVIMEQFKVVVVICVTLWSA